MKRLVFSLFVLTILVFPAFAQNNSADLETFEFISRSRAKLSKDISMRPRTQLKFHPESENFDIYFNSIVNRQGNAIDQFQVSGEVGLNNVWRLGYKKWSDKIKIPKLGRYDAEQNKKNRSKENTWSNTDIKYPNPNPTVQEIEIVDTTTESNNAKRNLEFIGKESHIKSKKLKNLQLIDILEGSMYLIRVASKTEDFYVVFRVDELKPGVSCKISWKKVEAPKEK